MKYRAEIDGLRAFAVIPVILFHAGVAPFSGGYIGVDVFFVISGYLITTLIAEALLEGRFSLLEFYERRARRILPALFVVMASCIPFAYLWMMPHQRADFFQSLVAVNLFGSNFLFWAEADYFDLASEMKPLLHTWSLAVEEQFYVVFPLILMAVMGGGRGLPVKLVAGLTIASFLACLGAVRWDATTAFYLTPFRAWELGVGSLTAFVRMKRPDIRSDLIAGLGLVAIIASVFLLSGETLFPSEWALLPVLGTSAVILFADSRTYTGQLLGWRPFVGIGLVSYSAYLWHQPLFAFARIRSDHLTTETGVVLIIATLCLAALTWRFVEDPVRHAARRRREGNRVAFPAGRTQLFATSGALAASFVLLGLWGALAKGFPADFDRWNVAGYRWNNLALQQMSWTPLREGRAHRGPVGDPDDDLPSFRNDGSIKWLVVGNSHAKDLYNALSVHPTPNDIEVARYGVQIHNLRGEHRMWRAPNYRQADVVFIASHYLPEDPGALPKIIDRMRRDGKQVVLVANSPAFWGNSVMTRADDIVLDALRYRPDRSYKDIAEETNAAFWKDLDNEEQTRRNVLNSDLAELAERSDAIYLNRMDYLCAARQEKCFALGTDLTKHFYDEHHTTLEGAKFFAARMSEIGWLDPVLSSVQAGRTK